MIQRAYKTKLDPNDRQRTRFEYLSNARMFMFNMGLREWQRQYKQGEKPTAFGLKRQFTEAKRTIYADLYDWASVPFAIQDAAFRDLGDAFKHFFRRVKAGDTPGYPRIKRYPGSFALKGTRIEADRVRLTGVGWVRLHERGYLPTAEAGLKFGTYATLSQRAGRWFISVLVEEDAPKLKDRHATVIGVDFGVKALATCSNGKVFENPAPLRAAQAKVKRLSRELSRRKKGGANWHKTQAKLAKAHHRLSNVRAHTLHKISDYLTREVRPSTIVLEDLNVAGMLQNHKLALSISDAAFGELRRQIEYKAGWLGIPVVLADRWYPSSKTCHQCGEVRRDLTLSDRVFTCPGCGFTIDRDLNAALNLAALGVEPASRRGLSGELGQIKALL